VRLDLPEEEDEVAQNKPQLDSESSNTDDDDDDANDNQAQMNRAVSNLIKL